MGQFAGDGGEKEREAAAHDAWFRREVQIGLDSANAGRLVSGDVVEAEAAAWRDAAAKMPDATSATHSDLTRVLALAATLQRSEERRVGKEGVSTCRSRGAPLH